MSLNPIAPLTDYQSMLNRIFWFTSAAAAAAIWLLRVNIPDLDALLTKIDFTVAFGSEKTLPMPAGYLLPALAVGLVTRIYRLHTRIADWLGIRECFDVDVIIAEFADQLAVNLAATPRQRLVDFRHHVMRRAFYPHVSGTQTPIDPQLIQQALDAWSWLWIGIEATLVLLLTALGLVACGNYAIGFETLGGTLALAAIGLPAIHAQCKRYAIAQVRAILSDPTRAAAARTAFADLIGESNTSRRAA